MAFSFGRHLKISIFGQSHSEAIGVTCEGLPAGTPIDEEELYDFLRRRAPGQSLTSPRLESDRPRFITGVSGGKTNGAPLTAIIQNTNTRSRDYTELRIKPRPGHSDYPAAVKFQGNNDIAGGGQFSARLTAPLCVIGGIVLSVLRREGIEIAAHLKSVGTVYDRSFDPVKPDMKDFFALRHADFPVLDKAAGEQMRSLIDKARMQLDSVGGTVECMATGLPVGIGNGGYGGLDGAIAAVIFGIPAVKGIEFGAGFGASQTFGSENNDPFYYDDTGVVRTKTNHCGGILGGMSDGMPVVFTVAFKPTPSIAREQETVNLQTKENTRLCIQGRHDPCVAVRAVPIVEAAAAVAIYDVWMEQ